MFGPDRLPTAQELQNLVAATQRDPGSPAFADLGEAYLALGRPQDAVQVGARGLQSDPNNVRGRLMVSRAFVHLHQWKQAQAELLKVVKVDRNNASGFLLLGEVLMRRNDYDRALPVLQHAQNLTPHDPHLHDLLNRARGRYPLDPPAPVPTPRQPAGGGAGYGSFEDDAATRVAGPLGMSQQMGGGYPGSQPMGGGYPGGQNMGAPMGQAPPSAKTVGLNVGDLGGPPPAADYGSPPAADYGAPRAQTPPPASAKPAGDDKSGLDKPKKPKPKAPKSSAPRAPQGGRARPRVLGEKVKDAAQQSLRASAAVGEEYLNNLLTAGLLDMPNVRAPEAPFEVAPGKRWGRSARRAFIFLFVMLFATVGGGSYWYYYAAKQRDAKVAKHVAAARQLMESGAFADLEVAIKETQQALKRDGNSATALAVYAKAAGLRVLLYGASPEATNLAEVAVTRSKKEIGEGDSAWRDLVIAQSALTLGTLHRLESPKNQLSDTKKNVAAWLGKDPDDPWGRWLEGKVKQFEGDYEGALKSYEQAKGDDNTGPVVATIAAADLYLDRGDTEKARELYDQALERAPKHPLALLGHVLLLSETSADAAEIAGAINVGFAEDTNYGPRVEAYKAYAEAVSSYLLEEYVKFAENLDKTDTMEDINEPRFLARVAYGRLLQGEVAKVAGLRGAIKWYGEGKTTPPQLVTLIDAETQLISGAADDALKRLEKVKGVRAMRLRGRALYDRGDVKDALAELEKVLEIAPDDLEALIWADAARLVTAKKKNARDKADRALSKLGRAYRNLMVKTVHGDALLKVGQLEDARRLLENSLEDITPDDPNPMAYRARVALAELEFEGGKTKKALGLLEQAAEQVAYYLPAQALEGQILLSKRNYKEAVAKLKPVIEELGQGASAELELAFARALVSQRRPSSEDRDKAREAVRRAKQKGASAEDLARVIPLVDAGLGEELGAPGAAPEPPKKKKKKKKKKKRRRRR